MSNIEQIRNNIRSQLQQKKTDREEAIKRHNDKFGKYYRNRSWANLREWKINKDPLCEMHLKHGIYVPATSVHHLRPFATGKTEEEKWNLLLCYSNLCACCESCHNEFHRQLRAKHLEYLDTIVPVELKTS